MKIVSESLLLEGYDQLNDLSLLSKYIFKVYISKIN